MGIWLRLRQNPFGSLMVLAYCGAVILAAGFVVVNLGSLFRIRDLGIVPLLIFWTPAPYLWLWNRFVPPGRGSRAPESPAG